MDAIVTAGGIPAPGEMLYPYTQGKPKALLEICGKPMIQWVLDALCGAETIDKVVVIGLPEDSGVVCSKVVAYLPNQGGMLDNIRAGVIKILEIDPGAKHTVVVSSDIPGITSDMVNWVVNESMKTDEDLYYMVITRKEMEARFPGSRRSYTHLKDYEVCGGDLNVIRTMTVTQDDELWKRIIAARKSVFKQAALIGYDTLFLLLLRAITMQDAVNKVSKRLKISGRAVVCPYPEIGMDVDKPFQLEIMRADLAKRGQA